MSKQSRLDEIAKKKFEKNIFLFLSGIIVLVIFLFLYGAPLLINFSLFMLNLKGGKDTDQNASYAILIPPVLDSLPDSTNSARLKISGSISSARTIKLYLNNKYLQKTVANKENKFIFNNITLIEGENIIKTKAVSDDNKESAYSDEALIIYKNKQPELQIEAPLDRESFTGKSQIVVRGKSDPGTQITVNNYWAITDNQGKFTYLLNLQKGENKIQIIASDAAGNKSEKEITVILNQ